MDFAANTLLTSTIHRVLHAQGFTRSSSAAASVLTDLLARYLTLLTTSSAKYATLCGRGGTLDVRDLIESLDEMGVSIDDLSDYCGGEGREFMHLISRRREEDLVELRGHLRAGLERDEATPAELEWQELPEDYDSEPDVDVKSEPDQDVMVMDFAEDLPTVPTHPHPDHIPSFLPPFPVVSEPEPEDADSALMPPPPVPLPGAANMPTLPSQTLTSTSTSAKDYLIRNQYELSSLSSTPEWHLPSDVIPSNQTTKALPLMKQQRQAAAGTSSTSLPTPHPIQSLIKAYHHVLTHPPPSVSELGPPSHAKHSVLLQMLFPSLSGITYNGSLTDKWDSPDSLYGTLGYNGPRPPGGSGSGLNGAMPYPLNRDPTRELVPKNDKGGPDDKVVASFPSLGGGRYISGTGVGTGGDRVVGLVGQKVGAAKLSELGRAVLHPQIRTRTTRLNHPGPLYLPTKDNMFQRLVYGNRGVEAPWNSTFYPIPKDDKNKSSSAAAKLKLSINGASKKRKKGAGSDDDDDDDEYNSDDSESTSKKKKMAKLNGKDAGSAGGKKEIQDARLWLTWDHDTKDFRQPLTGVGPSATRSVGSLSGPSGSANGVGTITLGASGGRLNIGGRRLSLNPGRT